MRFTPALPFPEQFIRPVLNPLGDVGIGGAAIGRVVLESGILGRIVRWSHDNAIRQTRLAPAVVAQNRA